ncbi:MAG: hypothetical protein ABEK10_00720 [Candidatus Nanosalina sp.]
MIVGFNVNSIDAEKTEDIGGNLQINYVPEIKEVTSTGVAAFDDKVAKIDFSFRVEYTAGDKVTAHIEMEGNVLWNGDTEKIVETWEDKDQVPENIRAPLMNDLYRKLLSEATGVADTLSMIPPIPTPQVQQE